ncbi:hypothetical protein [Nonomuraea aurantiaca]|uniref:hypothetical protein n=1 Tax=Nonomuraea aurantiaca TaxID=2878562 RepID=UPI001CDA0BBD|nr:hypothetical protein [Nonomuraea aurantiaca]MCA2225677.1 hypothetical protein [Nonomuraea aurantiaca]
MKRTIVGVTLIAGLAQLVATPAQAAPRIDPVKALQAAFTRGKGVNIVSTAKIDYGRGMHYTVDVDGTVGFGPQGETAADTSQRLRFSKTMMSGLKKLGMAEDAALEETPLRVISSRYDDYVSGPQFADALPQGTNWVRYSATDLPASNPPLEVLEPATLKALLAHRTSWREGVVKGTIKTDKLVEVSSSFAAHFRGYAISKPVSSISYTLRLSPAGLVERVTARGVLHHWKGSLLRVETDTRYSAWGREVTVLLPLRSEVLDQEQLEDKVPYQVPGAWN